LPESSNIGHGVAIEILNLSRRLRCRLAFGLVCGTFFALRLAADVPVVPDYRVGDKAAADIVTPLPLLVFDPARTELLRKAEAQKVPPIFRFNPDAARQSEEELRRAFAALRGRFLNGLQDRFDHPPPLLISEVAQPRFREFLKAFQQENSNAPWRPELAELWALGDPGDVVLDALLKKLRRCAGRFVRSDVLPPGERLVAGSVRLITIGPTDAAPTLATVDQRGRTLARTNLFSLTKIRQEALHAEPGEDEVTLEFVAGFLHPNCHFDEALSRQARARRTASINAADRYAAGQVLVRQGDRISARTKLALDELRARISVDRARATPGFARSAVEEQPKTTQDAGETAPRSTPWLGPGLGMASVICLLVVVRRVKSRRAADRFRENSALAVTTRVDGMAAETGWRERALLAEARAEKATVLLRANLLPHLARWMTQALVQRLLTQRSEILTSQQQAEREVAQLATRLENLRAPLEDRLKAYEKRIAELEVELAAKGKQNLELIQAKIEMTRKKLQVERSQEPLSWN